ncbi:MAG: tetratricopeptide repeat protein [Verrucomicrobiota bacterium]|jgi:tetratricopeptide (TPR) repeat protein
MNELLIGLVGALLATNQPQAVSNLIQQNAGLSVNLPNPNDPAEKELEPLMTDDDAAMAEVDKWIRDNNAFTAQGAGESKTELNARILARLNVVRKNYEDFLRRHPDFARGHLAYASFLNNIGDEDAAKLQNEKALQLDPKNPAAWNNLGNYYGEYGPITNAFAYFAKAIEIDPNESVYYQNLAVTVYLYRTDAKTFYHLDEEQVFDKSLALYRRAMQLDPDNFPLATEYAEGYYGIHPLRTNDALVAWTNTLHIAHDDIEREGVYIHLARIKMLAGRYAEARQQLDAVTNTMYSGLKDTLERAITGHQSGATHSAAVGVSTNGSGFPKNQFTAPTSPRAALTNATATPTNPLRVLTHGAPALTKPPAFPPKIVNVMTTVPPQAPKVSDLSPS